MKLFQVLLTLSQFRVGIASPKCRWANFSGCLHIPPHRFVTRRAFCSRCTLTPQSRHGDTQARFAEFLISGVAACLDGALETAAQTSCGNANLQPWSDWLTQPHSLQALELGEVFCRTQTRQSIPTGSRHVGEPLHWLSVLSGDRMPAVSASPHSFRRKGNIRPRSSDRLRKAKKS